MTLTPFLRPLWECKLKVLYKLAVNMCIRGYFGMQKFAKQVEVGGNFVPAFAMISITDKCNYACKGCWVSQRGRELSLAELEEIVSSFEEQGSHFFGLLGGEPLMHKGLLKLLKKHQKSYFQIFTNGSLLTKEYAKELAKIGNVTVLISLEGLEEESLKRRGRQNAYNLAMAAISACKEAGLFFGVATSVCKTNIDELVSFKHAQNLANLGVHYLWYYIYRPTGAYPNHNLALSSEEIKRLRKFIVDLRDEANLIVIDAYWDEEGRAICPAATGLSHHISPNGDLEFCPPLQFADSNVKNFSNTAKAFKNSEFLKNMRNFTAKRSRGCVLLEAPNSLAEFLETQKAYDSSGRDSFIAEMKALSVCAGHDMGKDAIAERNFIYRFLKKRYFFGFGAYG